MSSGESGHEGEQTWLAVDIAETKHYDERVQGEKQETEMIQMAVTMAMKIIQTYFPFRPLPVDADLVGAREYGGSQTVSLDESRGPSVAISMPPPQQGDQGFVANRRNGKDDPGKVVQNALVSAFGGVVVLCFSTLDNTLKENYPGYIRATMYLGLVVITGSTFVGLISNKRTKAAFKVVASAAVAAVSIAAVLNVSENVYIKATCGVLGAAATFAAAATDW